MIAEWRQVSARFLRFLAVLQPSAAERRVAWAAAADVAHLLHRRFSGAATARAPDRCRPLVVGGFVKGTAIHGQPVIDMLFELPDRLRPAAGSGAAPWLCEGLFDDMLSVLAGRYPGARLCRDGWLCVTPEDGAAGDGEPLPATVRVIPAFARAGGGYWPAVPGRPRLGRPARHIDPLAESRSLAVADLASNGKASHLVQMLKAWRWARRVPIAPFATELLVAEFTRIWLYPRQSALFYDWMIRDLFFWLTAQAGRRIAIPGTAEELPVGDAWLAAADAAYAAAAKAAECERDNLEAPALAAWREIFGHTVPAAPAPALAAIPG